MVRITENGGAQDTAQVFLAEIWAGLGGETDALAAVEIPADGALKSAFAVTDLAAAAIAAAGLAAAELIAVRYGEMPRVCVDRRLASFWFAETLRPEGWSLPPVWDAIAGIYRAADGWIRLHTNAPAHRAAALAALQTPAKRDAVAAAVCRWEAEDLESAIVAKGGCAAALRSREAWAKHPQGASVAGEPLLWIDETDACPFPPWPMTATRPLAGLRVLDLTRVLAGPVATRFLAGLGAEVLRIDPPWWDEPGVVPEIALGKRCARLDLRRAKERERLAALLAEADVLVHGYRPNALADRGFDGEVRRRLRPGLIDVSLNAYGWTGSWRGRRGFDSLVQMSVGIAAEGMRRFRADKPVPLPVQALDHATGYLMAAAAIRGLTRRLTSNLGTTARASLARTAHLLASAPPGDGPELAALGATDVAAAIEVTAWGPAKRLRPPFTIDGVEIGWRRGATALGSAEPVWLS